MKGAIEYANLFKTGQYGRLYITSGSHARGATFRIQVLPKGEKAIPNGSQNTCLNKEAIEVYGVISGQLGWTEVYGWLHYGKWQDDFHKLVDERKIIIESEIQQREIKLKEEKKQAAAKEKSI